ncbi:MAG: ferrochelatase, partial [Sphingopyxis sp.]|nr:ferrochelatase [Sphingopyxis sp.]
MPLPADPPPNGAPCIGVLLVNLGTPDAPDAPSVRRYLAQFLSDRRVVEIPQLLWQPILRGIILTTRPRKSAHAYAQVWTDEGSPLAAITRAQSAALQAAFGDAVRVAYAMRYGKPAIGAAIDELVAAGCQRILIAPLYPQYCAATTATVVDAVGAHLAGLRWQPALRYLPPYHDDGAYIGAL